MSASGHFARHWCLLLLLLVLVQESTQQKCYFKDGSIAADDKPCPAIEGSSDTAVPCCGSGRKCMSNRLCSGTEGDGNPSRGSCTDESWESGNCPQYCLNDLKGVAIYDCNARQNLKNSDGQPLFCCYQGNSQNCCTTGPLFTAEALRFTSSTSSTTSASSTAQSSATTATSSSSASITESAKPSATQEKAASSGTDHSGIGIGVGIGVAVPLLLIAVAGFLFWRRRRRHGHHSVSSGSSPSPDPNQRPAIPMPGAYSGDMDRRTAEARAYELESMRKPAELPGSEVDKKDFDNYQPRFLRPSSVDKLD